MAESTMQLIVFTPTADVLDRRVERLTAQGADGGFGILPRHVDFTAPLVPGLLSFVEPERAERFIAIDGGVLLKMADTVRIATRRAVLGSELQSLQKTIDAEFMTLSERETEARGAMARLEAGFIQRFIQINDAR